MLAAPPPPPRSEPPPTPPTPTPTPAAPPTSPPTAPQPTLRSALPQASQPAAPVSTLLQRRLALWLGLPGVYVGAWALVDTYVPAYRVSETCTMLASTMIALTAVRGAARPRRALALLVVAMIPLSAAAMALAGLPAGRACWIAVVTVVAACAGLAVYRRGLSHAGWAPRAPGDIVALLAGSSCAVAAVVLLGGYIEPGFWPPDPALWVRWFLRIVVTVWICLAVFLLFCYWRREPVGRRAGPLELVAVFGLGMSVVVVPYWRPDLPLSWLIVVPGLWAGFALGPIGAAAYCLLNSVCASVTRGLVGQVYDYDGLLAPALLLDLMLCFSTFLTLLLALFRDERLRMLGQLRHERSAARGQADLLRAMVDSMSDGMMLTEMNGKLVLQNPAARTLLMRPMPEQTPASWAQYYGARTLDGERIVDDSELVMPSRVRTGGARAEIRVGPSDEESRVISVDSRIVRGRAGHRVLMLFHDVTAEHARYRELRSFAGTVAHDLKGPLSAVSGWMEAADEIAGDDAYAGRLALSKARDASTRMRRLIDDYLSYAVTREGMLRPVPVSVDAVVRDIAGVYDALPGGGGVRPDVARDGARDVARDGAGERPGGAVGGAPDAVGSVVGVGSVGSVVGDAAQGSIPLVVPLRSATAVTALVGPPIIEIDAPHRVRADDGLLHQLVANLVGNAVKYHRPGERAHLSVRSVDAEPGWVRVEFADRGVGLEPGDEERIFAAFQRSDKDAGSVQGIGLGLALCHSIVIRHGGRIAAAANEHGGATFSVTLPAG